jgi:hypothetical protein
MKENGMKESQTEKEYRLSQVLENIKVNLKMVLNTAMVI